MTSFYPAHRMTPGSIQAAAALYRVDLALPATSRILELGCGQGDTLIANALAWPASVALGVDINEGDIACGQQQIQKLALTNIELHSAGLADLLACNLGQFEYIVIRGLYSLMGGEERKALLTWCQHQLTPTGIIAFHWQVLPGACEAKTVQDALSFHASGAEDMDAQLAAARGMLSYLAMTLPEGALKTQVNAAEQSDDISLMLRYLNDVNQADYFVDFHQQITTAGYHYLGDAVPQFELASHYGAREGQLHTLVSSSNSRVNAQQYLDFAVNRQERCSLLALNHEANYATVPDQEQLQSLHWAGCFKQQMNAAGVLTNKFVNTAGLDLHTENKTTLHILDVLAETWPLSMNFEQLLFHSSLPEETSGDNRKALIESLMDLFINNIEGLLISAVPSAYNQATNSVLQLIATPDDSVFAESDEFTLSNYWGLRVNMTREEWLFAVKGIHSNDENAWKLFCALREKALLTGSSDAWRKALQSFLTAGDGAIIKQVFTALLIFSCEQKYGGFQHVQSMTPATAVTDDAFDTLYEEINTLIKQGRSNEGRDRIASLLEKDPKNVHLLRCQSRICLLMGLWKESLTLTSRLLAEYAMHWDSYFDLATVLFKMNELLLARKILRSLLRIDNKNANCWNLLACIYHERREMGMAEKCGRQSLRIHAGVPYFLSVMGIILSDNQKMTEARYFLEKSLELKNTDFDVFTSLLFVMTHDNSVTAEALFARHLEYGQHVSRWVKQQGVNLVHGGSKDPIRKLRVGFVSGDLREHPVSNFFRPFWDNINREYFDLIAYNTIDKTDKVSQHFANTASLWRSVAQSSDIELAKQIAEDQIDILIDLSGHTTGTRLPVFGFKPAPVQMTWIGYPGTSGLTQMDYRITTPGLGKPGEMDSQYTEKLLYIPLRSFFSPSPLSPEVNSLPALSNGYFTYGSFNRPKKLNDEVFALWAQILIRNTRSKILIGFMDDDKMIERYRKKLCSLGVLNEQLIFRKTTNLESYLHLHHQVDILLDSFPYTGGTTTSHGVWMGVPTLSIAGATTSSRQGVETMHIYGLQTFIANSKDDYVEKAIYWQAHLDELNAYRLNMRQNMPVKQTDFNAAELFEKALRQAWQLHCAGLPAQSFTVEE